MQNLPCDLDPNCITSGGGGYDPFQNPPLGGGGGSQVLNQIATNTARAVNVTQSGNTECHCPTVGDGACVCHDIRNTSMVNNVAMPLTNIGQSIKSFLQAHPALSFVIIGGAIYAVVKK